MINITVRRKQELNRLVPEGEGFDHDHEECERESDSRQREARNVLFKRSWFSIERLETQ